MSEEAEKVKLKPASAARRTLKRRRKLPLERSERDGTYKTSRGGKVDMIAIVVDSGDINVTTAENMAIDAGDGAKIVAVHEVSEVGKDRRAVTIGTAINYPK